MEFYEISSVSERKDTRVSFNPKTQIRTYNAAELVMLLCNQIVLLEPLNLEADGPRTWRVDQWPAQVLQVWVLNLLFHYLKDKIMIFGA